jgi:type VI secretion system protein ImpA
MLDNLLNGIAGFLQGYIDAPEAAAAGQAAGAGQAVASGGAGAAHSMQEIRSGEDAVVVLKKICDYFARNEPSSPVPLLLRRAQRLISKSFLEVIADVCPDAMKQVEMIGGVSSRGESSYEASQAAK